MKCHRWCDLISRWKCSFGEMINIISFRNDKEMSFFVMNHMITSWFFNHLNHTQNHHQFSSLTQSCPTLCDPMDCSTPGFSLHHRIPELTQIHAHWVNDAIQPSHPLSPPSPPAFNLSQHQGLFKWVSSSHQVSKVLEFQLQHQSFQWIFRSDFFQDRQVWSPCSPRD